jgi:hypothetical protein
MAAGAAMSRACSRDQSNPSMSAVTCEALSRIMPSQIGGVPARYRADRLARLVCLGNDQRLLLARPTAPAPGPGKHLDTAHRLRLTHRIRLKQKLSV